MAVFTGFLLPLQFFSQHLAHARVVHAGFILLHKGGKLMCMLVCFSAPKPLRGAVHVQ
jgi:hypothetical protein